MVHDDDLILPSRSEWSLRWEHWIELWEHRLKDVLGILRVQYCEWPGCWNRNVTPCHLTEWDGKPQPTEYYCSAHASDAGFCWGCGQFWAGIESFDFSRSGLCDNCDESEPDYENYVDEDDYYPGPWDD